MSIDIDSYDIESRVPKFAVGDRLMLRPDSPVSGQIIVAGSDVVVTKLSIPTVWFSETYKYKVKGVAPGGRVNEVWVSEDYLEKRIWVVPGPRLIQTMRRVKRRRR